VAQLSCAEVGVMAPACTLEMVRPVGVGVEVCPLLGLTTPAQPARPKLKNVKLVTTVSSRNARLLAERAALSIFQSPRRTTNQPQRARNTDRIPDALWRLLTEEREGNWTQDANEGSAGGRIRTGL